MTRRTVAVVVLAAAVPAAAALAQSPGPDGVIHACVDDTSGALRVINPGAGDVCRGGETALDWNRSGPPGPLGPAGPAGAAVPDGSAPVPATPTPEAVGEPARRLPPKLRAKLGTAAGGEPTKVFSVHRGGGLIPPDEAADLTVALLPLPPGRYLAIAKANSYLASGLPETYTTECRLRLGADTDDVTLPRRGAWAATVVGRLKRPGVAELRCWSFGPAVGPVTLDSLGDVKLTAINVAAISNKPA